jgi:hypothetical protein
MRILLSILSAACFACHSSPNGPPVEKPAAAGAPSPGASATGFRFVENGRETIAPAGDGSFTLDGPTKFTILPDGTLKRGDDVIFSRAGDAIRDASGKAVATVTAKGLSFGPAAIEIAADGTLQLVPNNEQSRETFQVVGLTDANRTAVMSLIAFMMLPGR